MGGSDRWEFLIAGDVCRQVAEAEGHAKSVETVVSPEAWRCTPHSLTHSLTLTFTPALSLGHPLTLALAPSSSPTVTLTSSLTGDAEVHPTHPAPTPPAWLPLTTPPPIQAGLRSLRGRAKGGGLHATRQSLCRDP